MSWFSDYADAKAIDVDMTPATQEKTDKIVKYATAFGMLSVMFPDVKAIKDDPVMTAILWCNALSEERRGRE